MSMGTVTMLCVGWFLGQAPSDVFYTNQRNHRIPLNFQEARRADIREMILFASNDQGKTWQQMAVVTGDKEAFTFTAPTDGQYWLQVASVNRQGKQEPENIPQTPPQQKMIIDTLKPLVRITSAQRQGEDIVVAWEMQEDHPDWAAFRLEYQVQPSLTWNPAKVQPAPAGQTRIPLGNMSPVALRLQVRDLAGNVAMATAEVQGSGTLAQNIAIPPTGLVRTSHNEPVPPPAFPTPEPNKDFTPAPPPAMETTREVMRPMVTTVPEKPIAAPVPPTWTATPVTTNQISEARPIATSVIPNPPTIPTPAPVTAAPRKPLPALQYVNNPEVTLEYELSKVGPSGVGSVDLWWTQNDGQSWERYAFDPEAKGPGRHQRIVELPGDGVFGFQLVVKSRAGLGRKEPRPGDAPEIRVEVDTIPPVAQLFAPVPDAQRANALVLSWQAKDSNLTTHPISLEWAERREGPWQPIATNLSNTGKHSWQLPDHLPVQVYLRIRARDCAGNEGVAVTPEPQLVDLSEPEGRLLNVTIPPRR